MGQLLYLGRAFLFTKDEMLQTRSTSIVFSYEYLFYFLLATTNLNTFPVLPLGPSMLETVR
jgi:hypothetical protein